MKKSFTLSVPEPCHENWNDMTPNEQGHHCAVCTKTVVDFTRKTDREIAKLVKSGDSLCGRFKKEQLGRPISLPRKRDAFFEWVPPSYAASLLIPIALFGTQYIKAQETKTIPVEQVSTYRDSQPHIQGSLAIKPSTTRTFELKGTVSDEGGSLPGATVIVKGTKRGVQADIDGNYTLQVKQDDTLVISFIGYASQEIKVDASTENYIKTVLTYDDLIMGDIIIVGKIRTSPNLKLTPDDESRPSQEENKK